MLCPKCNNDNADGTTFCTRCGANLKVLEEANRANNVFSNDTDNKPINDFSAFIKDNNGEKENDKNPLKDATDLKIPLNYFMYIILVIINPIKSYKEEKDKLLKITNSAILSLILVGLMTLSFVIRMIISTVRTRTYNINKGFIYEWEWDKLQGFNWFKYLGKYFLIYAAIIAAIAGVFYIGSLIIKKDFSFNKSLAITATAVIPVAIVNAIVGPLFGIVWVYLQTFVRIASEMYLIVILYELISQEMELNDKERFYFNFICIALLCFICYVGYIVI